MVLWIPTEVLKVYDLTIGKTEKKWIFRKATTFQLISKKNHNNALAQIAWLLKTQTVKSHKRSTKKLFSTAKLDSVQIGVKILDASPAQINLNYFFSYPTILIRSFFPRSLNKTSAVILICGLIFTKRIHKALCRAVKIIRSNSRWRMKSFGKMRGNVKRPIIFHPVVQITRTSDVLKKKKCFPGIFRAESRTQLCFYSESFYAILIASCSKRNNRFSTSYMWSLPLTARPAFGYAFYSRLQRLVKASAQIGNHSPADSALPIKLR